MKDITESEQKEIKAQNVLPKFELLFLPLVCLADLMASFTSDVLLHFCVGASTLDLILI